MLWTWDNFTMQNGFNIFELLRLPPVFVIVIVWTHFSDIKLRIENVKLTSAKLYV